MKRKLSVVLSFVLVLALMFTLTACGGGDVNVITLDKTSLTLGVGEEYTLTATTDPAGASLTWTSEDPSVATVTDGKVKGVKCGYTNIYVEAKNGIRESCFVTVKEVWQAALENTFAHTNYTAEMTQDLGMGADNQGTYDELYGIDITRTVKFDKASNLLSSKEDTSMTMNDESLGSMTTLTYGQLEGDKAYAYYANYYGTEWESWGEEELPDYRVTDVVAYLAFEPLQISYNTSGYESATLTALTDYVTYDAATKKLTVTGVSTLWTFMDPEGRYLTREVDAELEVMFENNLVKSYKLSLSRAYSYGEIFGGEPGDGEPATLQLVGEITGTVVYGNTQVSIAAADQPQIDILKATRPLAKAFGALEEEELNFTLMAQSGQQTMGTAKYSISAEGGVYSMESTFIGTEYASVTGDDGEYVSYLYFKDGGDWYKRKEKKFILSDTTSKYGIAPSTISQDFLVGGRDNPDQGSLPVNDMYTRFTKSDNNTYTATFVDRCYDHWDSDLEQDVYTFADCLVTVKLDSEGRLSSVEYDYGSKADGENFVNLKYTFTDYGTTQATIPQSVLDGAKEILSQEDSEVYQAFDKLYEDNGSSTVVWQYTDNANSDNNATRTEKVDVQNGKKETVYTNANGSHTSYEKLTEQYRYRYENRFSGMWFYEKNETYDYESALRDFARISLTNYDYSLTPYGSTYSLQYLFRSFEKSGNTFTADVYYKTNYNGQYQFVPAKVTIVLDGEGRITSIKIDMYDNDTKIAVEQYTVTYGSTTVTFPAAVENATEYVSSSDSEFYMGFNKLDNNKDSVIVNYTYTDHNDSENNLTVTEEIDVANGTRKDLYTGKSSGGSWTYDGKPSYKGLISEGSSYFVRYYHYNKDAGNWYYTSNEHGDYEYALEEFARLGLNREYCSMYRYSATQGGEGAHIRDMYLLFEQSGNQYTATLYYVENTYDDSTGDTVFTYTPCTVTVQLDGEGRVTSFTIDIDNGTDVHKTHQCTFSYDNVTVTLPDDVAAATPQ